MEARFRRSYFPSYFSLEDILTTQERIPCKFEVTVNRLGFLDPSTESEDIPAGTTAQLPFWLARSLSQQRLGIISVEIPKVYKEAYREILKADASIVDLHKIGLYFYEFGSYLASLHHRDASAISGMLVSAFKDRVRVIMDWAQNLCTDHSNVHRLDTLEKKLYQDGLKARIQFNTWLSSGVSKICASELVVSHKKRKRTAIDI